MKKPTNIWCSRGLSVYAKVTIIKSLLIPKLVYTSSLLPNPTKVIKNANRIIYTFLWNGKDKMTWLSAIYDFEQGGIRMIDIENTIMALRRREYMEDLLNVTFKRCWRTFYFWMQ